MNAPLPSSLLIVAGWGCYPRLLLEGARRAGVKRIVALGFRGSLDRRLGAAADALHRIPFGSLSLFLETAQQAGCEAVVMGGQIHPLSLFRSRFDEEARRELSQLPVRNAHTLFGRLTERLIGTGLRVLPASLFMRDHLPAPGLLTSRAPDERERADMIFGLDTARAVCNLDIGQTLVVKEGVILAVEAFEGTNAAILRGARLGGRGAVVVKVAKEDHDMRFDIPVIGLKTLAILRRRGVRTLGIQAGRVLLLEQPQVIEQANRMDLAIEAFDSGLPPAPVFGE